MNKIEGKNLDPGFKNDVADRPGGENLRLCFACGTCTAGCPVAEIDPEFDPRRIIRQILLGMRKEVLGSPAIWRCVQCYSCTAKCPQNVRFREIVRVLWDLAVEEGYAPADMREKVEDLAKLSQKARRNMAAALASDRGRFEDLRSTAEQIAG